MARDYSREYAARKAKASARGTSVFGQRSKAAKNLGYSSYAQRASARKSGKGLRAGDVLRAARGADKRQVIPTPAGDVVRTTPSGKGRGVIEGRIGKAKAGARVTFNATVTLSDGTRRDVIIGGRGGYSAAQVQAGIAYYGSIGGFIAAMIAEMYGDGWDASDGDDDYDGFDSMSVLIT